MWFYAGIDESKKQNGKYRNKPEAIYEPNHMLKISQITRGESMILKAASEQ